MRYEIILAPQAVDDIKELSARTRKEVIDAIEIHLRHEPEKVSGSRIKRLSGLSRPQFRLRVGDVRVFYDINRSTVEILAVISKAETVQWLEEFGTPE